MVALRKPPAVPAEVVRDPTVMSGEPVVRGTRVPAETIVAYLRAGRTNVEIFEDYPTLPIDGIDAVVRWAEDDYRAGLDDCAGTKSSVPLTDKLFIDECLSTALVAVAKTEASSPTTARMSENEVGRTGTSFRLLWSLLQNTLSR